ncbi:MAG: DMT family transporter, partial [Planctomycetota bacterium]
MERQKKAYLFAFLAIGFWSTSASAFKICLERLSVPVLPLLFGASLVSSIALFFNLLFSRKVSLLRALSKEDFARSAFLGFLSPFLYYVVLFEAYSRLRAQEAQPLNFVWPLVLVLLSVPILKQKIHARDILAILISFFGVLIISTEGRVLDFRDTDRLGVALATGSSIPWAVYWIYNMKDKQDEVVRLFLNFTFASVYVLLLMLALGRFQAPSLRGALGIIYVGLFEMGITFLIWLKALKLAKSTASVSSLIYLVPFLAFIV